MSNPQTIQYTVHYDYLGNILSGVISVDVQRFLHPRDDTIQITLAGFQTILPARELFVFRTASTGQILLFRGITTNISYSLTTSAQQTVISGKGYWRLFEWRLLKIEGLTPSGFPTNPFIMTLNPTLQFKFGTLFTLVVTLGFNQNYGLGSLQPIVPIPTDFDNTVVNSNMFIQYDTIAGVLDRLVTSAIPDTEAEYKLDFSGQTDPQNRSRPTITVKMFNPTNGQFGIGSDKSSTISFIEGSNIASYNVTIDWESSANNIVLTGAQFRGSETLAAPIGNDALIARFGLKQIQKSIGNVVDPEEIRIYATNLLPLIQNPIPQIELIPVPTYDLTTPSTNVQPGDVVTIVSPSLAPVIANLRTDLSIQNNQFTARVISIQRTWSVQQGESVKLNLTYPVSSSAQPIQQFVLPSAQTMFGSLKAEVQDALFGKESAPSENLILTP
jgi:hypothetical protein